MRYQSLAVMFALSLFSDIAGFATAESAKDVLGEWEGKSMCQVSRSACHDEDVVYHITELPSGKFSWKADKIIAGKCETMGVLACTFGNKTLVCRVDKGTWTFHVDGTRMTGTLRLTDGTLYRSVDVKRVRGLDPLSLK